MIRVTMICLGGISTKLMANKVKAAAEADGEEMDIITTGLVHDIGAERECDIVIIAPQIRYAEKEVREKFAPKPVLVIEAMDYGLQNGEAVYKKMKALL